jgi:hypothetical protein
MDTTSRGWELTRAAGEGGKTTCSHSRCQTMTENDVTARKYQDFHKMKTLQAEEKEVQAQKMARQLSWSPCKKRQRVGHEIDAAKLNVERKGMEGGEMLQNPVTTQLVEDMAERSSQAQAQ